MSEEKDIAERLGVVEFQLETMKETLSKVGMTLSKMEETLSTFIKSSAVVEARLLAQDERITALADTMNRELARGREHMTKTDEIVAKIQRKCDQTEAFRIAGQKHLEESPREFVRSNEAWFASGTAMKIVLAFMGLVTFLIGLVLYMLSKGATGIPGS